MNADPRDVQLLVDVFWIGIVGLVIAIIIAFTKGGKNGL